MEGVFHGPRFGVSSASRERGFGESHRNWKDALSSLRLARLETPSQGQDAAGPTYGQIGGRR